MSKQTKEQTTRTGSAAPIEKRTRDLIETALLTDAIATETTRQEILALADGKFLKRDDRLPLPVWCRKEELQRLTGCPDKWLIAFAVRHPADFRKFADARNGSAVYRVAAVLDAIEAMSKESEVNA